MQKFEFLRQPLLGELAMSRKKERRREREEKKMPFIVATYVYASIQGQRTHSAGTNLMEATTKVNVWIMHKSHDHVSYIVFTTSTLRFNKLANPGYSKLAVATKASDPIHPQ